MEDNTTENRKRRRGSSALWAIAGILLGFALPVIACAVLFFAFIAGIGSLGEAATQAQGVPIHVSGPLTGPAIALIEVNGQIVSGRAPAFSGVGFTFSENIISQIKFAAQDSEVHAILLKVNSPGGSVVASDEIYQELKRSGKPVVVLMGELAASGGYYISMAGDYLFANPNSLVGSIGVISTLPNAEELFKKVGVKFNVFTSGDSKDFGSLYRDITPEERAYWQAVVDETHQGFVEIVAEGRGMSVKEVQSLADGRVYTGRQALELGLVDELGYEEEAIQKAAVLAALPGTPRVIRYTSGSSLFSLLDGLRQASGERLTLEWLQNALLPKLEFRWAP